MTGISLLTLTHMDTGVTFYHLNDERAFFEWLTRIPCVQSCEGEGNRGLVVRLKRRPGKDDLRQLLALCDPQKYWHRAVFGKPSVRRRS